MGYSLSAELTMNDGAVCVQMSAEMMKNMSKEDLAKMQSMAASTGGPSRPTPSGAPMWGGGGAAPPGNMAEMMNNPEAMNSAMNMMKNMDKDSLKNMLKMSQPGVQRLPFTSLRI